MTTIAEKDRPKVRELLARELAEPVELLLFIRRGAPAFEPEIQGGQSSAETRELLEELASLSDRLAVTVVDVDADPAAATQYDVVAVPTVIVQRRATDRAPESGANVRFLGLPGGYEFSTLLADIVDISTGRTDLSDDTVQAIRAIEAPVHIQVFVTPGCPYCPRAARAAHQLAMQSPSILAEVVEANELTELSERYAVRSVPKTVINGRVEFVGSLPEGKLLEAIQKAVNLHD